MIDVREIKLNMRYPESRQEDITDAFMRGYTGAVEIGNKAIEKLEAENEKLRELCEDMLSCIEIRAAFHRPPTTEMYEGFADRMRELGVEVDG